MLLLIHCGYRLGQGDRPISARSRSSAERSSGTPTKKKPGGGMAVPAIDPYFTTGMSAALAGGTTPLVRPIALNLARTVLRPGDKVQRWPQMINSKRAGVGIYRGKHRKFTLPMRVQSHRPAYSTRSCSGCLCNIDHAVEKLRESVPVSGHWRRQIRTFRGGFIWTAW
jgi:hypothetical protein